MSIRKQIIIHLDPLHKKKLTDISPRTNWGHIFPEMAEKGPNYETILLPLLFPYECIKRLEFSRISSLNWLKPIGPIFDKTRYIKVIFTKRPN